MLDMLIDITKHLDKLKEETIEEKIIKLGYINNIINLSIEEYKKNPLDQKTEYIEYLKVITKKRGNLLDRLHDQLDARILYKK